MEAKREKGSRGKVPDEPNPLEQGLQLFEQLAERGRDPEIRRVAAWAASQIKYFKSLEPLLSKAAKQLGIDAMCEKLPGEEIAFFIALSQHGGESNVRRMLRKNLVEPSLQRLEKLPGWNGERFLTFCCLVFNHALWRECLSRRRNNENAYGRAVREALVEEGRRGELIVKLGKDITRGLIFPNEVPWNSWWESEEAPAEAILKIWEQASEFTRMTPVAADPKACHAFMEGSLNKIPQQARDHVRTLIETELRHSDVVINVQGRKEDGENGHFESSSHRQTEGMQVLVEIKGSRPADQENKILVEQLLSLPGLKSADKEIVRLCLYEGRTQKETATALGMSQGQVNKRLRVIRGLTKAVQSRTQSES